MIVTVRQIIAAAAKLHGCTPEHFVSACRERRLAWARQRAIYLAREMTRPRSLPDLGRRFGNRDHTTVLHALRRVEERRTMDGTEDEKLAVLRSALPVARLADWDWEEGRL